MKLLGFKRGKVTNETEKEPPPKKQKQKKPLDETIEVFLKKMIHCE